jgi:CheY-like chemotaxis protein
MSDSVYKVLCVDDEQRVLDALRRHLQESFHVLTATSGAVALNICRQQPDLAVVVSDMRMPEMDGATVLSNVRKLRPSAVRVLLTGQADMAAAIKAINEGQIFRFLTKPCAPDHFMSVMQEAIRQHELIVAEKVLLQRTLLGAIKAIIDIMTLISPEVVGRAQRLKRRVSALATVLHLSDRWQVEAAALLAYLGQVSLPESIVYKLSRGRELDTPESTRLGDATRAANRLISHVPRLEPVSALLMAMTDASEEDRGRLPPPDPLHAQVLQIALEVEHLEAQGLRGQSVLESLDASGEFPEPVLAALKSLTADTCREMEPAEVAVKDLNVGMVLDEDIKTTRDVLIAPRGCEVTQSFIEHIRHFLNQLPKPTIAVLKESAEFSADDTDVNVALAS